MNLVNLVKTQIEILTAKQNQQHVSEPNHAASQAHFRSSGKAARKPSKPRLTTTESAASTCGQACHTCSRKKRGNSCASTCNKKSGISHMTSFCPRTPRNASRPCRNSTKEAVACAQNWCDSNSGLHSLNTSCFNMLKQPHNKVWLSAFQIEMSFFKCSYCFNRVNDLWFQTPTVVGSFKKLSQQTTPNSGRI